MLMRYVRGSLGLAASIAMLGQHWVRWQITIRATIDEGGD
jgi:hypothetical protein